jgi:hypothetical protein
LPVIEPAAGTAVGVVGPRSATRNAIKKDIEIGRNHSI